MEYLLRKSKNRTNTQKFFSKNCSEDNDPLQKQIKHIPFTKDSIFPSQIKPQEPFGALRQQRKKQNNKEKQNSYISKTFGQNIFQEKFTIEEIRCRPSLFSRVDTENIQSRQNFRKFQSMTSRQGLRSSISSQPKSERKNSSNFNFLSDYAQYQQNKQITEKIQNTQILLKKISKRIEKIQSTPQIKIIGQYKGDLQEENKFIEELQQKRITQKIEAFLPQPSENLKFSNNIEEKLKILQFQTNNNEELIKNLEFNPETDIEYVEIDQAQGEGKKKKIISKTFYGFKEKKALLQVKQLFDNEE